MKFIAVNGSPRKRWNTATLLDHAVQGAASKGAETQIVHLYDLAYKGCVSCFACKKREGKSYGTCILKDELTDVLASIREADALVIGSPVYFGNITGETQSFIERLVFPYLMYIPGYGSLFSGKLRTAWMFTMNVPESAFQELGYDQMFAQKEGYMARIFGSCESLKSTDTLQFDDYTKVVADAFDPGAKQQRREQVFPQDCQAAFDLGARLVAG